MSNLATAKTAQDVTTVGPAVKKRKVEMNDGCQGVTVNTLRDMEYQFNVTMSNNINLHNKRTMTQNNISNNSNNTIQTQIQPIQPIQQIPSVQIQEKKAKDIIDLTTRMSSLFIIYFFFSVCFF